MASPEELSTVLTSSIKQPPLDEQNPCSLCSSQTVTLIADSWSQNGIRKADATYKRGLFHIECPSCSKAEQLLPPRLCTTCQHLRIRHLIICRPTNDSHEKTETVVTIDPFHEGSADCEFCDFVATCLIAHCKHSGNDVAIMMNGTFSLGLPRVPGGPCRIGPLSKNIYARFNASKEPGTGLLQLDRRVLLSETVDWPTIGGWLSEQHITTTQDSETLPYLERELRDVRVIDITQSRVVNLPPSCRYVALSYVWGTEPAGQFQTVRSNISELGKVGSLARVELPRTITDAIAACKALGQNYLWIDRLCIIQDDFPEMKATQLDQMGAIYRKAAFTIVAVAGQGATYGLPGVTLPRLSVQKRLNLHDIELIESIPSLSMCLNQSKWQTRGWTYQESEASIAMLYFTDFGVYYRSRRNQHLVLEAEGPAQVSATLMDQVSYMDRVEAYTKRSLTYLGDILRAFSGILNGMYGPHMVFGMPLKAFDRAILWESFDNTSIRRSANNTFPTWSWLSAYGPIHFRGASPRGCSLAFWGIVTSTNTQPTILTIPEPSRRDEVLFYDVNYPLQAHIVAALAWQTGCIRSKSHVYLLLDCPREAYKARLQLKWPDYVTYWHDAFDTYKDKANPVFSDSDIELARVPGRIMVHAQTAWFTLDYLTQESADAVTGRAGRHAFLLRSKEGLVAGGIYLPEHWASPYRKLGQGMPVRFIALSTSQYPGTALMAGLLGECSQHVDVSTLYGCGCSKTATEKETEQCSNLDTTALQHIPSCPQCSAFSERLEHLPTRQWPPRPRRWISKSEERDIAYAKHLESLSYFDAEGGLLHPWDDVPTLNVMMIGESREGGVWRRFGIGHVYLRKWGEAGPGFETVVLE
ncbi:HET-domain-containing protein [Lophium mytilinum]|uniref:HET-domain-containing protein n=1 Tax=Lophium mytilinum TaxID=390894 RepID=A0A6A6RA48_9PEZI|nr:HET-domain-containing protein [Lophium mytilinum]